MKKFLLILALACGRITLADELESRFEHPPEAAKPGVLWMWMGGNVSSNGITRDLEALDEAGFGSATVFSLADVCTPWAGIISNCPTPEVITFTEPWWKLVRHAASESRRLGLDFGVHNCAGYESSGGPWITPELSMQEIVWSETKVSGGARFNSELARAKPDLHARQSFPLWNPMNGKLEKPEVPARQEFYRDVAVLALPAGGVVGRDNVVDLSSKMSAEGKLDWDAPPGDWIIYRFGRTTMGTLLQPCQWDAIGLECDKMSREAVEFHMVHIIGEAKRHLGDLVGNGFNYYHFDSYEAGTPGWTPKMREEFAARRGYDLTPFLPTLAKRVVGSEAETKKFQADFKQTIRDLYRVNYFPTIQRTLNAAGLKFMCEPYGGPWNITDVVPQVDRIVTEFWTKNGSYRPYQLEPTVTAVRAAGRNIIEAEAYTGAPGDSEWTETPAWLKSIGDAAFCDGVNRMLLHRFTHQPFDERWKPGVVMGQWGTHFDRTQTWWEQGKAWVQYLTRCQALLQWGEIAANNFAATNVSAGLKLKSIHRSDGTNEAYFIANLATNSGTALGSFDVTGKQPELWNPVTGARRELPEFEIKDGKTFVPLEFSGAESCFIVFRKPVESRTSRAKNFPELKSLGEITGDWRVAFDPKWGGPEQVMFEKLEDWTACAEPDIKFYSGAATYTKTFDLPETMTNLGDAKFLLALGVVREVAEVRLNGKNLGVVWTAPWWVDITSAVKPKENQLEIKVVNVWANRLIGDEHEPADCEWNKGDQGFGGPLRTFPDWFIKGQQRPSPGRHTFTTWNYFTKDSPLVSSGLLGPVTLLAEANASVRVSTPAQPTILTPKPPLTPRITGPKIFGVRPGSPFLFRIPATGERPLAFVVENLPAGLSLDADSGIITGTLKERGTFAVTLLASNALGVAKRDFRIEVGDRIALTPPMGWNSYYGFRLAISDKLIREQAEAMVKSGLADHGWSYLNLDEGWTMNPAAKDPLLNGMPRESDGRIRANRRFPDMKALCNYVHDKGLKIGLYSSPGPLNCGGFVGSYQHEEQDAQSYADWGFDFLKYDWCSYKQIAKDDSVAEARKPYELMAHALKKARRDIVFSFCQYGMGNSPEWAADAGGNTWRTTRDIIDKWETVSRYGFGQAGLEKFSGPGRWNDPDMLMVGVMVRNTPSRLTPDEQYTHVSLWCLLNAPLLIGGDLRKLDEFTLGLLTNDEVIEVNQDPLGQQASRIAQDATAQTEVWAKRLEDGARAVGLFNRSEQPARVIAAWSALQLQGRQTVRDLWRQKDLGVFPNEFAATVPAHGVELIRVEAEKQ